MMVMMIVVVVRARDGVVLVTCAARPHRRSRARVQHTLRRCVDVSLPPSRVSRAWLVVCERVAMALEGVASSVWWCGVFGFRDMIH